MWTIRKVVKTGAYLFAVVPGHPKATEHSYVLMHRVIMENQLDRLLEDDEVVHHRNGRTHDNRPENLRVMINGEHTTHHGSKGKRFLMLRCPQCEKEFHRARNRTHLRTVTSKTNVTCCTRSCSTRFAHAIQVDGITDDIRIRIENNILGEYILGGEDYIPFEYTGEPECYEDYRKRYNIKSGPVFHKCSNSICDNMCSTKYCSPECAKYGLRQAIRPTKHELQQLLINCSCESLGKLYGVSGNAVRKWCKVYGLSYKKNSQCH